MANKANKANEDDVADKANEYNNAVETDLVNLVDNAIVANGANENLAANKTNVINETIAVNKAAGAKANESVAEEIEDHVYVVWVDDSFAVPFSLTKYSANFAEVKELLGVCQLDNQLGRFGTAVDN